MNLYIDDLSLRNKNQEQIYDCLYHAFTAIDLANGSLEFCLDLEEYKTLLSLIKKKVKQISDNIKASEEDLKLKYDDVPTDITLKAYIPSHKEYLSIFDSEIFRPYIFSKVSEQALKNGLKPSYECFGNYLLRDYFQTRNFRYINGSGAFKVGANPNEVGIRLAFQVKYNESSPAYQKWLETKKERVKQDKSNTNEDILKFGGYDCLWLNEVDCALGKSKTMQLITLDIIDIVGTFKAKSKTSMFGIATDLHKHCEELLFKNCTQAELDSIVPVKFTLLDFYEHAVPILN